jgi:hypothetical protein
MSNKGAKSIKQGRALKEKKKEKKWFGLEFSPLIAI